MTEPLKPAQLRWDCPLEALAFETTDELEPCDDIIGQDAAAEALKFGLAFRAPGQHVFVRGNEGTGRLTLVRRMLDSPTPIGEKARDRVIVMDLDRPDRPALLSLRAGRAPAFIEAMDALVELIRDDLVQEVESTVAVTKQELDQASQAQLAEHAEPFEAGLAEAGLALARVTDDDGETETRVLPMVDGQPVQVAQLEAAAANGDVPAEEVAAVVAAVARFTSHLAEITRQANAVQRKHQHALQHLFSGAAVSILDAAIAPMIKDFPLSQPFLEQVRDYTAEHLSVLAERAETFVRAFEVNVLRTRAADRPRPV